MNESFCDFSQPEFPAHLFSRPACHPCLCLPPWPQARPPPPPPACHTPPSPPSLSAPRRTTPTHPSLRSREEKRRLFDSSSEPPIAFDVRDIGLWQRYQNFINLTHLSPEQVRGPRRNLHICVFLLSFDLVVSTLPSLSVFVVFLFEPGPSPLSFVFVFPQAAYLPSLSSKGVPVSPKWRAATGRCSASVMLPERFKISFLELNLWWCCLRRPASWRHQSHSCKRGHPEHFIFTGFQSILQTVTWLCTC